jgi:hypothetical protein
MICGNSLLWNRKNIAGHARRAHGMPAQEYATKFKTQILAQLQNLKLNQSKADKESEPASVAAEKAAIRTVVSKPWYLQQGGYRCPLCHLLLSRRGNLSKHIRRIHQLTPEAFAAQYGELPEPEEEFICKICDVALPWDPRRMKSHLESMHFLSLEKYRQGLGILE